jgi:hypothetical protein
MNKLIIIFALFAVSVQAQINNNDNTQKKGVYYWFYINLNKTYDKTTGIDQIFIKNISNEIVSGTFEEFVRDHESALKAGRITIGPFSEDYYAQESQSIYRNEGRGNSNSSDNKNNEEEVLFSYFFVKPVYEDSSKQIIFEPIPSRVTTGTENEFIAMLGEGLSYDKLAIGPFDRYVLAEKSKYVFRKNTVQESENKMDSAKNINLKMMAKKWKNLKLEIVKKSDDKKSKQTIYRFNTKFPGKYFAPYSVQVITITASYSNSFETSSASFTLQGDEVIDNNYSISSESGTYYINMLYFDDNSPAKITGFLFESFIYNDSDMILLDPVYIAVK